MSSREEIIMNVVLKRVVDAVVEGTIDVLAAVLEDAVKDTPIDTGALRKSGYISVNNIVVARSYPNKSVRPVALRKNDGDAAVVKVGFSEYYAAKIHEDLYAKYKFGKAKFLENSWMKHREKITKINLL